VIQAVPLDAIRRSEHDRHVTLGEMLSLAEHTTVLAPENTIAGTARCGRSRPQASPTRVTRSLGLDDAVDDLPAPRVVGNEGAEYRRQHQHGHRSGKRVRSAKPAHP